MNIDALYAQIGLLTMQVKFQAQLIAELQEKLEKRSRKKKTDETT